MQHFYSIGAKYLAVVLVGLTFYQCGPTASKVVTSNTYDEDLSVYRDSVAFSTNTFSSNNDDSSTEHNKVTEDVKPVNGIASELDSVINIIIDSRKNVRSLDGFAIQLYSGNNRERANEVHWATSQLKEDFNPKLTYDQPNYKVKVGQYYSRLEANEDYTLLKKTFSRAVLVPAQIPIETE